MKECGVCGQWYEKAGDCECGLSEGDLSDSVLSTGSLSTLDELRDDLTHQLGIPDDLDWDYFAETALRARSAANREDRNMSPQTMKTGIELLRKSVLNKSKNMDTTRNTTEKDQDEKTN